MLLSSCGATNVWCVRSPELICGGKALQTFPIILRSLLNTTNLPAIGTGELNTPKQKKSFLVGPPEPAGGGPLPKEAMALAGVGLAWLGQLALRGRSGPKHPTWIALVGWLDARG